MVCDANQYDCDHFYIFVCTFVRFCRYDSSSALSEAVSDIECYSSSFAGYVSLGGMSCI